MEIECAGDKEVSKRLFHQVMSENNVHEVDSINQWQRRSLLVFAVIVDKATGCTVHNVKLPTLCIYTTQYILGFDLAPSKLVIPSAVFSV